MVLHCDNGATLSVSGGGGSFRSRCRGIAEQPVLVTGDSIPTVGIYVALIEVGRAAIMIYGIPLLRNRVAPRCTIADSILLLEVTTNKIVRRKSLRIGEKSWNDLLRIFGDNRVDTLVCGGIDYDNRTMSIEQGLSVIDNVACTDEEVIEAIRTRTLKVGFGLLPDSGEGTKSLQDNSSDVRTDSRPDIDCLACKERQCVNGMTCDLSSGLNPGAESKGTKEILNSALDISLEDERILCRLSELVYFALDMNYRKIGIAHCVDLSEPAEIVAQVMRRFFDVYPVCCKIGGRRLPDSLSAESNKIACNPAGQADILNAAKVDFNVMIGLCIGTDSIFAKLSNAPVSTLFVKDKSLANNPIGAVYLDHYLKEVTDASPM